MTRSSNNLKYLCLLVFTVLIHTISALAQSEPTWQTPPPLQSEELNEPRGYRVMLPDSYTANREKNYPLLVLLDAQNYGDLVAVNARFLASTGDIPEHLIVAVNAVNRLRDYTPTDSPYWEGDGGGEAFLKFLQNELIPEIEKQYRIKDQIRILWGHSAGGLFALYPMYEAPDLFDAHLVNDGSLDWHDKISQHSLQDHFKNPLPQPKFLYFNSSYLLPVDDPEMNYFNTMAQMLKNNAPETVRWVYDPLPQETHSSIPLLGSIRGLRELYKGYKVPENIMFEGLDAVKAHYRSIQGNVGAPEVIPEHTLVELGYLLLGRSTAQAVASFELATQLYPLSENAWDSLSDGYLEDHSYKKALAATEKSIELAKKNNSENLDYYREKRIEILEKMNK